MDLLRFPDLPRLPRAARAHRLPVSPRSRLHGQRAAARLLRYQRGDPVRWSRRAGTSCAGVLAMAPLNKVCYGSDGFEVPEIKYTSAKLGKQAVASVLSELVSDGMLTQGDAESAAGLIVSGNARELYRI